ncbi:MFS transporter [Methanobrevibacter sp. DSM 116169]|uniref:MFS transporter n=1 Tax=Methanobrevibacter sp. DSM 116169 TaxID=3242727 RepID=UPI0038FD2A55
MGKNNSRKWLLLIIIACASFVIALDSTFMNVAITSLVKDLNTDIGTIQTIITFYTLITASLMLVGAKLQDIYGQKKIFLIGAIFYGVGTFIASISQSAPMLFFGWSLLEGIGGALMTPATLSIVSRTYTGKDRTIALSIVSAMAGIAAAIGPLFGGFVTTFLSWRFGFAVELIVIIFIFVFSKEIKDFEPISTGRFDKLGSILSIFGLVVLVIGILAINSDFVQFSPFIIVFAIIILAIFYYYENKLKNNGNEPLFDVSMLKIKNLSVGSIIRLIASVALAGALFSISIFLQSVMKIDAFTTGLTLVPLTIGLLLFALISPRLTNYISHKLIICFGFVISIIGALLLRFNFGLDIDLITLLPGMFLLGGGLGFVISLILDLALNEIEKKDQASASGFISTSANLGISMGTAVIGTILILGAFGGLYDAIDQYYPEKIDDAHFKEDAKNYVNKVGTLSEDQKENYHVKEISNIIVFNAMKLVMNVIILILIIGLGLSFTLKNIKYS